MLVLLSGHLYSLSVYKNPVPRQRRPSRSTSSPHPPLASSSVHFRKVSRSPLSKQQRMKTVISFPPRFRRENKQFLAFRPQGPYCASKGRTSRTSAHMSACLDFTDPSLTPASRVLPLSIRLHRPPERRELCSSPQKRGLVPLESGLSTVVPSSVPKSLGRHTMQSVQSRADSYEKLVEPLILAR